MSSHQQGPSTKFSRIVIPLVLIFIAIMMVITVVAGAAATTTEAAYDWRNDSAWFQGKAEFALYDATRPIYGKDRRYQARIFTNRQHMDPATKTKVANPERSDTIDVFKHNVSEIIDTENYTYRFLTTCFVHADTLEPYKLAVSTQEDCGSTYKQITFAGGDQGALQFDSYCYFPETGEKHESRRLPGHSTHFALHDNLTLTLRDYPFHDPAGADPMLKLIPDQTDTHETSTELAEAKIEYIGAETVSVPYGDVATHHLKVQHVSDGGVTESHYWFAADGADMRHVLVRYEGPYGVTYELRKLASWAYWDRSQPEPN